MHAREVAGTRACEHAPYMVLVVAFRGLLVVQETCHRIGPITRVSEHLPVQQLLDMFIKKREHMFLVEDEYGQTAGVVTLEDAIETMLGREILDETDKIEDLQEYAKDKYRERLRNYKKQ